MGAAKDCSPAAVAYAESLLARADTLGFSAAMLAVSRRGGQPSAAPVVRMRAAIAHAIDRAGISLTVFRRIAATAAGAGAFRDVRYRRDLQTEQLEATILVLTRGIAYEPPAKADKDKPGAADAKALDRAAAERLLAGAERAFGPAVRNVRVVVGERRESVRERAMMRAAVFAEARKRGIATDRLVEASGIGLNTWHNADRILCDPRREAELAALRAEIVRAERGGDDGGSELAHEVAAAPRLFEDDPVAILADITGKVPQSETWTPSPQEQG